jgi:hypothetical protein
MSYRCLHVVRHVLPDDRLVNVRVEDGLQIFEYRAWHIHPALVARMRVDSEQTARAGLLDFDVTRVGGPPTAVTAWMALDGTIEEPMTWNVHPTSSMPDLEYRIRSDMIDPALLREMNEEALPFVLGAIVLVRHDETV